MTRTDMKTIEFLSGHIDGAAADLVAEHPARLIFNGIELQSAHADGTAKTVDEVVREYLLRHEERRAARFPADDRDATITTLRADLAARDATIAELQRNVETERAACSTCNGSGHSKGGGMVCPDCEGSGKGTWIEWRERLAEAEADLAALRTRDAEREKIVTDFLSERATLTAERDALTLERDALREDVNGAFDLRDAANRERDAAAGEAAAMREALNRIVVVQHDPHDRVHTCFEARAIATSALRPSAGKAIPDRLVAAEREAQEARLVRVELDARIEGLEARARRADAAEALAATAERAASTLRAALVDALTWFAGLPNEGIVERYERVADEFYAATRMLRPGKSQALEMQNTPTDEERNRAFQSWARARADEVVTGARAALTAATPAAPPKTDAAAFLDSLARAGGYVVSSNECSAMAIAFARAEERMFVTADGLGFVRRPPGATKPTPTPTKENGDV